MATYSSFLVWRIPWMEEPGRLQSTGSKRVRHNWATSLFFFSIFDVHHQTSACKERLWWKKNFFINKFFETQRERIFRSTACTSQEHHWNNVPLKTTWQISILLIDYLKKNRLLFSSVQSLSPVRLFATPWTTARQASLSITNSRSPPKSMSIKLVMPSNHLILWSPLLLLSLIFSSIRVLSSESALCIRWPKYWSFSFNISPSNEHPGLMSFRMDWVDLLAVHGTL